MNVGRSAFLWVTFLAQAAAQAQPLAEILESYRENLLQIHAREGQAQFILWPQRFGREAGKPQVHVSEFRACSPSGSYTLVILSGDAQGRFRVSSATVQLNRKVVARPSDFNQTVFEVRKEGISLQEGNRLEVEIQSAPGAFLTIYVVDPTPQKEAIIALQEIQEGQIYDSDRIAVRGFVCDDSYPVLVNGVAAIVQGSEFFANEVPLAWTAEDPRAVVRAQATHYLWPLAEDTRTVRVRSVGERLQLSVSPSRGAPPLAGRIVVEEGLTEEVVGYELDFGDGSPKKKASAAEVTELQNNGFHQAEHTYGQKGIFKLEVVVKTVSDSFRAAAYLVVAPPPAAVLQVWDAFRDRLVAGDLEGALKLFDGSTVDRYREHFSRLGQENLRKLALSFPRSGELRFVSLEDSVAHYKMTADRTVEGVLQKIVFSIFFIHHGDGTWKIVEF